MPRSRLDADTRQHEEDALSAEFACGRERRATELRDTERGLELRVEQMQLVHTRGRGDAPEK